MPVGYIHFFHASRAGRESPLQAELLRHGLGLSLYKRVDALCASLKAARETAHMPRLVLLAASHELNCRAAAAVRDINPHVCVVALAPSVNDGILTQALRGGVDACWPARAPSRFVAAGVLRLLHGRRGPRQGGGVPAAASGSWRLASRAWVVQAPDGSRVGLTTTERALMLALHGAPGQQLSHAGMLNTIDSLPGVAPAEGAAAPGPAAVRRLGVLMSRLRRKFSAAGLDTPFRSVRGVGYELCVDFDDPADGRQAVAAAPVKAVSGGAPW